MTDKKAVHIARYRMHKVFKKCETLHAAYFYIKKIGYVLVTPIAIQKNDSQIRCPKIQRKDHKENSYP